MVSRIEHARFGIIPRVAFHSFPSTIDNDSWMVDRSNESIFASGELRVAAASASGCFRMLVSGYARRATERRQERRK